MPKNSQELTRSLDRARGALAKARRTDGALEARKTAPGPAATSLGALGGTSCAPPGTVGACIIDTQLASGIKSGYSFTLSGTSGTPNSSYQIRADPQSPNQTGVRYFCTFADAVIRFGSASLTSCTTTVTPLQ